MSPIHALGIPVITAGNALTVIFVVALHPDPMVYMIIAVPAPTPVAIPVAEPIVATEVLLLLHVPPPDAGSENVVFEPAQIVVAPDMADTSVLTVTVAVTLHPVGNP